MEADVGMVTPLASNVLFPAFLMLAKYGVLAIVPLVTYSKLTASVVPDLNSSILSVLSVAIAKGKGRQRVFHPSAKLRV